MSSTRWRPETCECVLEFTDPDSPPNFLERCEYHRDATGLDVWNENRSLNDVRRIMWEEQAIDPRSVTFHYKPSGRAQRALVVDVPQDAPDALEQQVVASPFGAVEARKV
jgi:hypothetical protein